MKLLLLALFFTPVFSTPAKLTILVQNVKVDRGSVVLAVYNGSNNFFKKSMAQQKAKAGNHTMEFSFQLPEGDYAVAVYQDVNDNKALDKGWLGIPKEPYGFSNNFRPKFSAPVFNDCKFRIAGHTTTIIVLK